MSGKKSREKRQKKKKQNDPPWTPFESMAPDGLHKPVFKNSLYQVSVEEIGEWTWLAIVRRDRSAVHDWRHLQRIKNEICGPGREAIELYPAESRLVDTNNQFHLWVLPEGAVVPVGYNERDVGDREFGAHKQRPFDEPPEDLNARGLGETTIEMLAPRAIEEGE